MAWYALFGIVYALFGEISDCEFGDSLLNCTNITHLSACYDAVLGSQCCKTCKATGLPGCEFGDIESWCNDVITNNFDCYANADTCCGSCERYKTNISNCDYGDRVSWCAKNITSGSDCYNNNKPCCQTCNLFKSNLSQCEFGDQQNWCKNLPRTQCYLDADICCGTCSTFQTNVSGCEFGDKISSCSLSDCTDSFTRSLCCATCSSIVGPTTATLTRIFNTVELTRTTPTAPSTTVHPGQRLCQDQADWCKEARAHECYGSSTKEWCCQTCTKFYKASKNCEYGDRASWCKDIEKHLCYSAHYQNQCCATCSQLALNITGCEYGDRAQYCSLQDCTTQNHRKLCCLYCSQQPTTTPSAASATTQLQMMTALEITSTTPQKTNAPNTKTEHMTTTSTVAECTDQASWCYSLHGSYCYDSKQTCCSRCTSLYTGIPGCEYGDHYRWCSASWCNYSESLKKQCCQSCQQTTKNIVPLEHATTSKPDTTCLQNEAPWCANIPSSYCYSASTRSTCCKTCRQRQTGPVDCPFGDQRTWCSTLEQSYCSDDLERICCKRCRRK